MASTLEMVASESRLPYFDLANTNEDITFILKVASP